MKEKQNTKICTNIAHRVRTLICHQWAKLNVHFCVILSEQHVQLMGSTSLMKSRALHRLSEDYNSIFLNNQSFTSAQLAVGGCFAAVDAIVSKEVRRNR